MIEGGIATVNGSAPYARHLSDEAGVDEASPRTNEIKLPRKSEGYRGVSPAAARADDDADVNT
jgi:hypothetical protein